MRHFFTVLMIIACVAAISATKSKAPSNDSGTGSISGFITDSITGSPIADAEVIAGCHLRANTNEDGSYTITNVPAGEYTVKAKKCHEYVVKEYPTPVQVEEGQHVTGINIALAPVGGGGGGNGSISGTVYDKRTNEPIVGARVTAGCCRNYAMTEEDGTYTIHGLRDGSYTVKAHKNGYEFATYPTQVEISGGNSVSGIDFYLIPKQADSFK